MPNPAASAAAEELLRKSRLFNLETMTTPDLTCHGLVSPPGADSPCGFSAGFPE
jgi:hypothetical protein